MRFVMNPDMVYQYPIWAVGLLLVGAAIIGAVLLELCARRLLPIELRQRHNDVAAAIFSIIGVTEVDRDLHSLLLQATERLWDARQERLLAAQSTIPGIVWFVVIAGGALTVAFGSFLGAPSLRMQLAMSASLAASGALVLILIIALSNPFRGDFRVSTAPFEHVLSRIEAPTAQP